MSATRSAIAAVELAVAVVGVAFAVSRHPLFRAGMKAAPHLMTPAMKESAVGVARDAAYAAGVVARRVVSKRLIR